MSIENIDELSSAFTKVIDAKNKEKINANEIIDKIDDLSEDNIDQMLAILTS